MLISREEQEITLKTEIEKFRKEINDKFVDYIDNLNFDIKEDKEFMGDNQHYRYLSYHASTINNSTIIDIGTHLGKSALALSLNETNNVYSFDLSHNVLSYCYRDNIEYINGDLWDINFREIWKEKIISSPIIFLDVDPHNGFMEYEFYCFLLENDYKGRLICDDIWLFEGMRNNFWYKISEREKFDATEFSHYSGTGIINFSEKYIFPNNNWTLLTAYYDLTKYDDASEEIKNRNRDYYLKYASETLSQPYNMIIYTDSMENVELLKSIRPKFLEKKTVYVIKRFDEFELLFKTAENINEHKNFSKCREIIKQNRIINPYSFDPRNTPSYYLFCISRYLMMLEIINSNPFHSEYFCWINICMIRMGYQNLMNLELSLSCCLITT